MMLGSENGGVQKSAINEFWLVTSFGSKQYITEMKIANSVLLSLFMTSNEICNTGHAP